MATRTDYRDRLKTKILGLEDEGYGDFEFQDTEHDVFLELSITRLFPSLYKKVKEGPLNVATYGTRQLGAVTTTHADAVFLVEDSSERTPVTGWKVRAGELVSLPYGQGITSVNVYFIDAFTLPTNDNDDAGIPATYTTLIILGALIEALESRHDTGVRGEPPPTGPHQEVPLIDRLVNRYEQLKADLAMSLPGVVL